MQSQLSEPFKFYTRLTARELTGYKAVKISQLLRYLRVVPDAVVYYHTHHFLQQHQFLNPEPPNDFAYWAAEVLGDKTLGERLASIDTVQFGTIRGLRDRIVDTIEHHLSEHPEARVRFAGPDEAFYFMKAVSVVLPTPYQAWNLKEFADCLKAVSVNSLYYHVFEARLRLKKEVNDFAAWFDGSLGEHELARAVGSLDPYTHTMDELRQTILRLVERRAAVAAAQHQVT